MRNGDEHPDNGKQERWQFHKTDYYSPEELFSITEIAAGTAGACIAHKSSGEARALFPITLKSHESFSSRDFCANQH
jgi:hypothetical protein